MNPLTKLAAISAFALSLPAAAALTSYTETFDGGVENWTTTLPSGGGSATISQIASGGEDGGAYITTTGDVTFGPFGPVGVVFRCNNDGISPCSGGNFFGDYEPDTNDTSISFYLRHNAGVNLDFFARLAPDANSPGAGTGSGAPAFAATVASGVWTQLTLDIEANFFDNFSGTDFDTVFANTIERLQIGVNLPFNGMGFDPLIGVTYDLDTVSLANTAVPLPAGAWLFGSALAGLGAMRRKNNR